MKAPSLRQWWTGFTFPAKTPYPENWPGVMGLSRQISEQLARMPDEDDLTPAAVVEWMAEDLEIQFSDGSPKRRGSDFTLEESLRLNFALSLYLAMLVQDFETAAQDAGAPFGFRESIGSKIRELLAA